MEVSGVRSSCESARRLLLHPIELTRRRHRVEGAPRSPSSSPAHPHRLREHACARCALAAVSWRSTASPHGDTNESRSRAARSRKATSTVFQCAPRARPRAPALLGGRIDERPEPSQRAAHTLGGAARWRPGVGRARSRSCRRPPPNECAIVLEAPGSSARAVARCGAEPLARSRAALEVGGAARHTVE